MKLTVLVTGVLRNFQKPLTNLCWPEGLDVSYRMITWDKTQQSYYDDNKLTSAWPLIEEASQLLNFESITVNNLTMVDYVEGSILGQGWKWNNIHGRRMYNGWLSALTVAKQHPSDAYVIIRPDCAYIPNRKPVISDIVPTGIGCMTWDRTEEKWDRYFHDVMLSFVPAAIPTIETTVKKMLDKARVEEAVDTHTDLYSMLHETAKTDNVDICTCLDAYWYFAVRRPGYPGKFTPASLDREVSNSDWHEEYQKNTYIVPKRILIQRYLPAEWNELKVTTR